MKNAAQANRRVHSRRTVRIAGRLTHGTEAVEGTIENVGAGGVFFSTQNLEIAVGEGSPAVVAFRCLRSGAPAVLELPGTILRTERYFDGEAVVRAFAMKFDDLIDLDEIAFE